MKRMKKHKVKKEIPETSSAYDKVSREHDLAYYIHDRVELMHQVFSVLRAKDLRAMAPESVRRLSINDLQELCTEELLGISSKRLCAILDGAEPPSDTDSSSHSARSRSGSAPLETISLDSISSDDEILTQTGSRKKKRHKHRSPKPKRTKKKSQEGSVDLTAVPEASQLLDGSQSRASRAGLTVLELLELQARARAIRAQLQQEQARKALESASEPKADDDGDEVEIKEEAPEVVEISSEDEKPDLEQINTAATTTSDKTPAATVNGKDADREKEIADKSKDTGKKKKKKDKEKIKDRNEKDRDKSISSEVTAKATDKNNTIQEVTTTVNLTEGNSEVTQTVTKRVNNLLITIPQQTTRKIKLNRTKMTVSVPSAGQENESRTDETPRMISVVTKPPERLSSVISKPSANVTDTEDLRNKIGTVNKVTATTKSVENKVPEKKSKDKKKKLKIRNKNKRKSIDKEGSDHDEITLQLSDSEKMDLLEDFDRKHYDNVSSTEDSDSSSETDEDSDSNTENESSKNKTIENRDSPLSLDKNDVVKDRTNTTEVINDNFYKGIEDLDQETGSQQAVAKSTEDNSKQADTSDDKDKVTISDDTDGTEDEGGDCGSESDNCQEIKHDEHENLRNKDISPKHTDGNTTDARKNENVLKTTESFLENDIVDESQHRNTDSEIDAELSAKSNKPLGYVSIDKEDEAQNIEISYITDIPVINEQTEPSEDITNNKSCDQEVTVQDIVTKDVEVEQIEVTSSNDTNIVNDSVMQSEKKVTMESENDKNDEHVMVSEHDETIEKDKENQQETERYQNKEETERDLSEGEVSSNESSEVEAFELKPEVVCIYDEDETSSTKKKKKKDKKSKKEKMSKKNKSDFRESGDHNFYTETNVDKNTKTSDLIGAITEVVSTSKESDTISLVSDDDVYEILELSDDSSCYEVEGTVLSKEPTVEEIAALSAKIDEIERVEVVTEEQIEEHEKMLKKNDENTLVVDRNIAAEKELENAEGEENIENISWKDRYLGSKKVKRVLTTSNILNALRKKNKELKKKIEESKKKEAEELMLKLQTEKDKEKEALVVNNELEEGSIEQYNTLQGSTKYVDPVPDPTLQKEITMEENNADNPQTKEISAEERLKSIEIPVTGEMKKDAKQLLKIYKKLLKYNDISKQKDPNKVKKKKRKSLKRKMAVMLPALTLSST